MRAQRVWHIEETPGAYGNFRVVNQYGGFAGQHRTREAALAQALAYVANDGDTFEESEAMPRE